MGRINRAILWAIIAVGVSSAAQAKFQMRSVSLDGRIHVLLRDVATYYGMQFHHGPKTIRFTSAYSKLRFDIDKRECDINGQKVHLSYAPTLWKTEPVIGETDFRLLLDPVMRVRALPTQNIRRIMLDPGHGGRDLGASGRKHHEKVVVLDLANRLAARLRASGYTVGMTRTGDSNLGLSERTTQAKKWQADVFVSLHANYVGSKSVSGIECFIVAPKNTPSTYGNNENKRVCSGNRFDKQNSRLAYEIQKGLVEQTRASDRGVKHAQFAVLRNAPCPAVLVETGFLSNASEEGQLGTAAYREKLAVAIHNGIVKYHRSLVQKD